jgi:hypothetical protein
MIHIAFSENHILQPIRDGIPSAVLQYADDTLIMATATPIAARRLKDILNDFALATGPQINFNKTTFIPMNVTDSTASILASLLGTQIHTFPQTYLGLPFSPLKLSASAFQSLLDRIDSYLADWRGASLKRGLTNPPFRGTRQPPNVFHGRPTPTHPDPEQNRLEEEIFLLG